MSSLDARDNAGVWTWTLGNGRWSFYLRPSQEAASGLPRQPRRRVLLRRRPPPRVQPDHGVPHGEGAPTLWVASWSRAGDGLQTRHIINGQVDYLFGGKRWDRISGPS